MLRITCYVHIMESGLNFCHCSSKVLVCKRALMEYSSNDGPPAWKPTIFPLFVSYPSVRGRRHGQRLVDPLADRIHEHLKVAWIGGQRCRPELLKSASV